MTLYQYLTPNKCELLTVCIQKSGKESKCLFKFLRCWIKIISIKHSRRNIVVCVCVCVLDIGLFEMIFGVLTTCHTQYTWGSSICIFYFYLIEKHSKFLLTYLTGALYAHPLSFYKHQHDSRVRSKLFVACQRWWFQWRFWFVPPIMWYYQEQEEQTWTLT